MKPPRLLLGAALLFWGWQTDLLIPGAIMALLLELPSATKARWEFDETDFSRVWTFCCLLFLAAAVYSFTANQGPAEFRGLFQNPNILAQRNAGVATARTAASLFRWLPMIFFLFAAMQAYSALDGVPAELITRILRGRWRRTAKEKAAAPSGRGINVAYYYFGICLFASSVHPAEDRSFFWGLCVLLSWGLWPWRSRRYAFVTWALTLGAAMALGYLGQVGIEQLSRYAMGINPQWFTRFGKRRFDPTQSRTSLGQIGRIQNSGQIVVRLEAKKGLPPSLLREASYRTCRGTVWVADTGEREFENIGADTNETTYVLVPGRTNSATVSVACYLDGGNALLPLPSGSGRLENLLAYILQKNTLGAVFATGPGLVVFDALYGSGQTLDSAANTNMDLAVPEREQPAIAQIAEGLSLQSATREEKLQALSRLFNEKYKYRTWQERYDRTSTNDTPLSRFLLKTRAGHCEYFATAGVLLLRQLNIPARYAVGYAVNEGKGRSYVVRQRDAHAWCLAWNDQTGTWDDFDPTPGSWVSVETSRASPFQAVSDFWSRIKFEISRLRWGQTNLRQYVFWILIPILIILLAQILFSRRRRRRKPGAAATGPALHLAGLDSEFYLLEERLAQRGCRREPDQPLGHWLGQTLKDPALECVQAPLRRLLLLHYRYRFDPEGLDAEERTALAAEARTCLAQIAPHP